MGSAEGIHAEFPAAAVCDEFGPALAISPSEVPLDPSVVAARPSTSTASSRRQLYLVVFRDPTAAPGRVPTSFKLSITVDRKLS